MPLQAALTTTDGRVIQGVSYRMAAYTTPGPSIPASPYPFLGGMYHLQTPLGWVDIADSDVSSIFVTPIAHS